ncbi:serine O-acetyltransferase [Leuconostocaceae bacterium ESL0723]|nr:serine O-acetyltransferase [Leuconostocaceae bacterium ESL0723]
MKFEMVDNFISRDPALNHRYQVLLFHPGYRAVKSHRRAHYLWQHGYRFLALWLANRSRHRTGIEIHPGAQIGRNLMIDHGQGVVIGQYVIIGNDVTIYQGVTLGSRGGQGTNRHPIVGDRCLIGAGAKILGAIRLGQDSKVGANAVVLSHVPAGKTVVGVPARLASKDAQTPLSNERMYII